MCVSRRNVGYYHPGSSVCEINASMKHYCTITYCHRGAGGREPKKISHQHYDPRLETCNIKCKPLLIRNSHHLSFHQECNKLLGRLEALSSAATLFALLINRNSSHYLTASSSHFSYTDMSSTYYLCIVYTLCIITLHNIIYR